MVGGLKTQTGIEDSGCEWKKKTGRAWARCTPGLKADPDFSVSRFFRRHVPRSKGELSGHPDRSVGFNESFTAADGLLPLANAPVRALRVETQLSNLSDFRFV